MASPHSLIEQALEKLDLPQSPAALYEPMRYFLTLGGKRTRPILLIRGHQLFGGQAENVLPQAVAIELFHNFTLIHDDIMDKAPLRRGKATVHTRWDLNSAMLAGDGMLVKAYGLLAQCDSQKLPTVLDVFTRTALEVCEGQQLDMDFEARHDVTIAEYLQMINLKTAVLLGGALQIGAILANADEQDAGHLYEFGRKLGIAFQLQDDLLDAFGDTGKFGKKTGGDIAANKKTYLTLLAFERSNSSQRKALETLFYQPQSNEEEKINQVLSLYAALDIRTQTREEMIRFHREALDHLSAISVPDSQKQALLELAESLLVREY